MTEEGSKKKRRKKNPRQQLPMERVMVLTAEGKKKMIWRPWS